MLGRSLGDLNIPHATIESMPVLQLRGVVAWGACVHACVGTESDDRESESTSSCNECAGNVQSLQARDYEEIDGRAGLDDASAHARDTGTYGTLS